MHCNLRSIAARLVVLVALVVSGRGAFGQGVTGSAVTGTVTSEGGGTVAGATVQARNKSTGYATTAQTDASGQYFLDNLPPGGPYVLSAQAPGFPPISEPDVQLSLGQRLSYDLVLKPFVEEVTVVGQRKTKLNDKSRTGSASSMKDATIAELPLQGRNFTDLIATNPGVTREPGGGVSIAGQNNRYNYIQIDGGANNDLFGLASSGTPGGQASAKPLSVEAIQEFVVQIAPFDVRLGNFTGGLVNAITKSGTNEFHGSAFTYFQNRNLTNKKYIEPSSRELKTDPNYLDYTVWQFGATVSGPVVEDKVHFFVAADFQDRKASFGNSFQISGQDPASDRQIAGFDLATAQRFTDILASRYGITNVGNALAPKLSTPDRNVFVKVTTSLIENSDLELSYNFVSASTDVLIRAPTAPALPSGPTSAGNLRDGYELSNSGYAQSNSTNTVRFKLTTNWDQGKFSNELLGGVSIIRDERALPSPRVPLILVRVCTGCGGNLGAADSWLAAGAERFSQANILDQDIYQVQDNLTFAIEKHRITAGTNNEFLKIRNVFFQASTGVWAFDGLDNLDAGRAAAFQRRFGVSDVQEPGTAAFKVAQIGFYLQDEWSPLRNLRVTPGLRFDVPFLSKANTNPILANNPNFPIDTSKVPSGNILWSPRVGFNWDVTGQADTIVRGGTGIFSGRPPYVWVSNAYSINGLSQVELTCFGASGVPAFTPDPNAQPTTCAGGTTITPPTNQGEIDYFDPNTKYPQNWRLAMGVDKRLPWGIIGTIDLLYTQDVNGWYTTDENLNYLGPNGEGRALYGTFGPTGFSASPSRIDPVNLLQAVKVFNKNGSHVYSGTIQFTKQFLRQLDVSVAYTYSKSEDRISLTSSQALSNFRFSPIDGDIQNRNVRPSAFDRPHKVTITGIARLPYGFGIGASYVGQSGLPYTWVVNGDVNGDGINGNDLAYIPADPSQITLQDPSQYDALNKFINSQSCLRDARGHFVQRGACRNPWQNFLDMRFSWISPDIVKGQHFEVQVDIFNVLNLLYSRWGLFEQATAFETHGSTFLRAVGYDRANNRPIYAFTEPQVIETNIYTPTQSRWRIQLGARYIF